MIRLNIDYLWLLILIPAVLQVFLCSLAKRNRILMGVLPLLFFVFSGYGYLADRHPSLPYPGLFKEEFIVSRGWAGFFAFGAMFIGTVFGTVVWAFVRKIRQARKHTLS